MHFLIHYFLRIYIYKNKTSCNILQAIPPSPLKITILLNKLPKDYPILTL